MEPIKYNSFNTIALFYPLIHLLEKLESMEFKKPNEVQSNFIENGYACAIIVLGVTIFESAVTFVRVQRREDVKKPPAADYFRSLIKKREICIRVDEIVSVRDAIVHSRVYSTLVEWDSDGKLKAVKPFRRYPRFGNTRLKRVRTKNQITKKLKLNLVPTRINRRDMYLVLKTLDSALIELELLPPGDKLIRNFPLPTKTGWMKNFHEIVEDLSEKADLTEDIKAVLQSKWPEANQVIKVGTEHPLYPEKLAPRPWPGAKDPQIVDALNWETITTGDGIKVRAAYAPNFKLLFVRLEE